MQQILVVNMNYLGDALLTTPAMAALRRGYPQARIDTVVGAGAAADVLRDNPDINKIIPRTERGSWGRCSQLFNLLRNGRYTDVIILPALPAYALTAFLARTPVRVGVKNRGMNRFLTHLRHTSAKHMADIMLDTIPISGDTRSGERRLNVTVSQDAARHAQMLLKEMRIDPGSPLVAVNVGATRPQKRWVPDSFVKTIEGLAGLPCVLLGAGLEEAALAAEIVRQLPGVKVANLVGRTDVKQLAALLSLCDVLLSADSGPMHLATAVGTPVVALFGSTDPAVTGPYDNQSRVLYKALPCAPCFNHPTCNGRYDCLRAITPEEVTLAIRDMVRGRRGSHAPVPQISVPLDLGPRQTSTTIANSNAAALSTSDRSATNTAKRGAHRILIETKFRFIGDTLVAVPILRAARRHWPDSHITLLTGRNARLLLLNNPYLDEIIEFEPTKADQGLAAFFKLVARLRAGRFDLCLSLNRSFHSALIPWLGGVKERAGFVTEGRGALLSKRVPYDTKKNEIACYFDVLRAVAPQIAEDPTLDLWLSDTERASAAAMLRGSFGWEGGDHVLVGIQPGASLEEKRWLTDSFASVADKLVAFDKRVSIVILGGPDETDAASGMYDCCAEETRERTRNFAGLCDLRGSLGLVSHLDLFVGNDTAVTHCAAALGIPSVALFGPTNPKKWGNYGTSHRVIESPDRLMASIAVSEVVAAARDLLASRAVIKV